MPANSNILLAVAPYVVLIVIFYFFLIRPQQKKEKAVRTMRDSLKEGDQIITIGGIYGKIVSIKDDAVSIEVGADKTKMKIAKWAIGKVVNDVE